MNDVIKEILEFKENADLKKLSCDEIAILKDYITNLQQENERLTRTVVDYDETLLRVENEYEKLKARIDKAIEYIENTPLYETTYDYNMEEELEIQSVSDETASNNLLNILRGKDNGKV